MKNTLIRCALNFHLNILVVNFLGADWLKTVENSANESLVITQFRDHDEYISNNKTT
jgi:hypothetical protein